jgi:uncharacterized membrane protein
MTVEEPINKVNLERLTNGIYAFTMTLMIRTIQTPPAGTLMGTTSLFRFIDTTILTVIDFIGAFLILGMFWLFYFQVFHRMKTYDYRFLYIHLLSLMIVVFVPFTQSFTSESTSIAIADILFQFNYLALSILLVYAWYYASRTNPTLLVPELTGPEVSFLMKKFLVPLGVAVFGIVLLLLGFPYFDILYLFPFIILAVFFRHPPTAPEKV